MDRAQLALRAGRHAAAPRRAAAPVPRRLSGSRTAAPRRRWPQRSNGDPAPSALAAAAAVGHEVAAGWEVFPGSVEHTRDAVAADPTSTRWGPRLFVADERPALVGWGGFKGAPQDGEVEIGYAVAPARRGRGVAGAAVRAMLHEAWAAPEVRAVLAHTLAERNASVRVLERAGFAYDGESIDGDAGAVWRWRLERRPAGG